MKITEVKKELLTKVLGSFKTLGFSKRGSLITKTYAGYQIYLAFSVVDNDNSFPTTFHFGISSLTLNNLLVRVFPEKGYVMNQYAGAYGQKQAMLFDKKEYSILEYDIRSDADIDLMVNDLLVYFNKKVIIKLEQLQNLNRLSIIVNSQETIKESMHQPTTAINGLILCKISGVPNYDIIKNNYINLSKEWSEWDRNDLEKTIRFLDNHSQKELKEIAETA